MAKNLDELISAKIVGDYYTEKKQELPPYLLEGFFPRRKQLGLNLAWIKGANRQPVSLSASKFDVKALPKSFGEVEKTEADMPFFKNTYPMSEQDRQDLNTALNNSNNDMRVQVLLSKVLDRYSAGIEDAEITAEIMRASLLTTGSISIADNGVAEAYNYNLGDLNKGTLDFSDTANTDIVEKINEKADAILNATGVRPNNMIINNATLSRFKAFDYVKNAFVLVAGVKKTIGKQALIDYLENELDMNIYVYDKTFKNASGVVTKLIPDDSIVLLPDVVGYTNYGTTPEESDLMNGIGNADVKIVNTGVAVSNYRENEPVQNIIKVSEIVLPSGENLDKIYCGTIDFGA